MPMPSVQPLPFADMKDTYPMLNGRGYPDTVNDDPTGLPVVLLEENGGKKTQLVNTKITASAGQKILLRISSLATVDYHTLTVLGIPMRVVGKSARLLRGPGGQNLFYTTSTVSIGGGRESVDVILDTAGIPDGTYFLYTTNLNHLNNNEQDFGGMMTEIVIGGII